jgi:hypothetical protein
MLDFAGSRELRDAGQRDIPQRECHAVLLKIAMEFPWLTKLVMED